MVLTTVGDRSYTTSGLTCFAKAWFASGLVEWASGANTGRRPEVRAHGVAAGSVTVELIEAPVRPIATSDAFTIRAGCDKQFVTCRA